MAANRHTTGPRVQGAASLALLLASTASLAQAQSAPSIARPWMDRSLTPDARASLVEAQMTAAEKHQLVFGLPGNNQPGKFTEPTGALGSAGFVPGIARLGIPDLQESDAGVGVAWVHGARPKRVAVSLPSGMATTASWDPDNARAGGAMIGGEAHRNGFNILLAGGVDLVREARNGRNFEYGGEDPLLAGTMVGSEIAGIQSAHVVSTLKHYAFNDQESGRMVVSADIAEPAAREADLLAFEIAAEVGRPGSVMCSYNRVNGTYACENPFLLSDVLKRDWGWPGFVMSDWGAVHSTAPAANAGLDQESAWPYDDQPFFGEALTQALASGAVKPARLDDMVHRILRSLFATGVMDDPAAQAPIDVAADGAVSEADAERGAVLLKNTGGLLPLARSVRRIAVIGAHADVGVLSGGGSSQVVSPDGIAAEEPPASWPGPAIWQASSPLKALAARLPGASIRYASGGDVAAAARLAADSDLVIVFADQWLGEAFDAPDLHLPHGQDALISAVARANPKTVVVLETGGAVLTPWRGEVGAILEAWYPGSRGGEAIARLLTGEVEPSGRLPITFPDSEAQLPRPTQPGAGVPGQGDDHTRFDVDYNREGARVGYKWFQSQGLTPAFAFGHGLGYGAARLGGLAAVATGPGGGVSVSFSASNTGARPTSVTPQVYLDVPARGGVGGYSRLVAWSKATLNPGETRRFTATVPPRLLADWDEAAHRWRIAPGAYRLRLGASSADTAARAEVTLGAATLAP